METSKTIGRYEILAELGQGAMGTVYRAKDPSMDRIVALKTVISVALASSQGSEYRERFYREARAAGRLAHPGIVPVFDVGEHEGLPFLVMEFIDGRTLADAVKKGERLTLERVCEIGQQIADALAYAHLNGVVHRDIKPANILLTSREKYGIERPKITDFGVAKLAAGQITTSGQMLGTPAFMPPEQFTGAPIDGRADLFSLGVILYWMATGEQPFPGETMTAVSYKVVHTEPVPPRKLNPSISENLDRVILKCLAKSPADRYQTGDELAQDLAAIRTGSTTGLHAHIPQPRAGEIESGVTLDVRTGNTVPLQSSAQAPPQKPTAKAPAKKSSGMYIVAAVMAAVVALAGWYTIHRRDAAKEMVPATDAIPAPAAAAPVAAAPVATAPAIPAPTQPAAPAKTSVAPPVKTTPAVIAAAAKPAEKTPPPVAKPAETAPPAPVSAIVDFDPKALDPKENAKIKIDASQMPANLDFSIEMNGKVYFQRSVAGNKAEYDDLFVPPGVQEFRVLAQKNGVEKSSNTVSMEFKAKKKKALKVELRTQGQSGSSGMPSDLYPDSQLVVTLK